MSDLQSAREGYLKVLRSEYERLYGTSTDARSVHWLETKIEKAKQGNTRNNSLKIVRGDVPVAKHPPSPQRHKQVLQTTSKRKEGRTARAERSGRRRAVCALSFDAQAAGDGAPTGQTVGTSPLPRIESRNPSGRRHRSAAKAPPESELDAHSKQLDQTPRLGDAEADAYFSRKRKRNAARVQDPEEVLEEDVLRATHSALPLKHQLERETLLEEYESNFQRWATFLLHGFGLLFHGFGSKKDLLRAFAQRHLSHGTVLDIPAYRGRVCAKAILQAALAAFKQMHCTSAKRAHASGVAEVETASQGFHLVDDSASGSFGGSALLCSLQREATRAPAPLFLVIHGLDSPCLRAPMSQMLLAELAAMPNVHLTASVDHVNAAVLWDTTTNSLFNWLWINTPTYLAYTEEHGESCFLLLRNGDNLKAKGAEMVLQSLTPNARAVFGVMANRQLAGGTTENGLSFQLLYSLCRDRFLVSSELTLRTHLVEFRDHELVRTRRGEDGQDVMYLPMASSVLSRLVEEFSLN